MALPSARVVLDLLNISGIPAQALPAGDTRYARAFVTPGSGAARIATGRSRPIAPAGGSLNLAAEAVPWRFELNMNAGNDIDVRIEICLDHGNAGPLCPLNITGTIADPWTSRTVTLGSAPACQIQVTTTLVNPTDAAYLARAAAASGISGVLTVPRAFAVQIVQIDGLYKPAAAIAPPAPGSTAVAGYISDDNLGRIFTNRLPNGNWQTGTQFIDVRAQVSAIGGIAIPGGAKVRWTVVDIDDPTNDASDFHREGGAYVDVNDYAAGLSVGAHPGDNAAAYSANNANEDLLFETGHQSNSRWDQAAAGPAPSPTSPTVAESPLTPVNPHTANTSVRIHCPNVLGTNFALRAELINTPAAIPVHNAATGVLTMWCRIQVEVQRMAGAHSLKGALPLIPPFFLRLCVQLDFEAQLEVTGAQDRATIAGLPGAPADENDASAAWASAVFSHGAVPGPGLHRPGGWFFLGAARFGTAAAAGPTLPAFFSGNTYALGTSGLDVWVEVPTPGGGGTPSFVEFTWTDPARGALSAGFAVRGTAPGNPGQTRILLRGNDVTPDFLGHDTDGSLRMSRRSRILFWPRHQKALTAAALSPGGFGVPTAGATVEVSQPGAVFTTGISPPLTHGGEEFFAGRTIIFTHTRKFSNPGPPIKPKKKFDEKVLSTVVHEFLHAFGMPHKCGRFDWRTPRTQSCCMNYFDTWLYDGTNLLPGTVKLEGDFMCARHLMEVRRVHFANNPALNW